MDHWRDLHDGIILYVYQHPGCTKHDIMSVFRMSEFAWRDHSVRFGGTLEYDRKKRGWFLMETNRVLNGVRWRQWEKEREKLADELLDIAKEEGFGETYAPRLRQAAEAYKRHHDKMPTERTARRVVRRKPTGRIDLLLNEDPTEIITAPVEDA